MALADWLGRRGDAFMSNMSDAGPQGLASLGAAIAGAPRNQWGAGIAQGVGGLLEGAKANRKKASLAEALKGAMGDFNPKQRSIMDALIGSDNVEAALPMLMKNAFSGAGKDWEAKDLDGDGRSDVQIESGTGKVEAYPLNVKERAFNMLFEGGVSPIAPGVGVDRRGVVVPMGEDDQQAQSPSPPQLRPTIQPEPTQAPPAAVAEMGAPSGVEALAPPPAVVSAQPTGTPAPGPAPIILSGDALKRMNLGQTEPGKQWALNPQTLKPMQVPIAGAPQTGVAESAGIRDMLNTVLPVMNTAIDDYETALDETTWFERTLGPFGGAPMAKLKTLHTDLLMQAKEMYRLGVLNGPDYQLMLQMADDPETWTATARGVSGLKAQLSSFRGILKRNVDAYRARAKESGVSGIVEQKEEKKAPPAKKYPAPPPEAIRDLKMRRDKAVFDEIFGPGAADKYLGK